MQILKNDTFIGKTRRNSTLFKFKSVYDRRLASFLTASVFAWITGFPRTRYTAFVRFRGTSSIPKLWALSWGAAFASTDASSRTFIRLWQRNRVIITIYRMHFFINYLPTVNTTDTKRMKNKIIDVLMLKCTTM